VALHIWVAQLNISPRTAEKITSKHSITLEEAEQAVLCVSNLDFSWDVDPVRGERAIVSLRIRNRPALLVLYDAGHPLGMSGTWAASTSSTPRHTQPAGGMMQSMSDDFYEDDEPVETIRAKFAEGQRGTTQPPRRGQTHYLSIDGLAPASENQAARDLVSR